MAKFALAALVLLAAGKSCNEYSHANGFRMEEYSSYTM
jgi:hypothetical protein